MPLARRLGPTDSGLEFKMQKGRFKPLSDQRIPIRRLAAAASHALLSSVRSSQKPATKSGTTARPLGGPQAAGLEMPASVSCATGEPVANGPITGKSEFTLIF